MGVVGPLIFQPIEFEAKKGRLGSVDVYKPRIAGPAQLI